MARYVSWVGSLGVGALLALGACSNTPAEEPPAFGRQVAFTPPVDPDPAAAPLPKNAAGQLRLTPGAPVEIVWAPPTPGPMTALSQCTRWISSCVAPPARTVDDCARSVPVCKTNEPWNEAACCPQACFDRYVAARKSGTKDVDAFSATYFDKNDNCIPGISALVKGKP